MSLNFIQTPYGRVFKNEAYTQDEFEFRKIAVLFPKSVEAMQSLIAAGLPKAIAESNVKDVEGFKAQLIAEIKEDGKVKNFPISKIFKDGDRYADDRTQMFKDNPENEGKEVPEFYNNTRGFYILNFKSKFDLEWYGPKKSDGLKDDTWAETAIYDGSWARLLTKAYHYGKEGNKGYSTGLSKFVQKWCDDEKFGGSGGASADVSDAVEFVPKASAEDYIN